MMGLGRAPQGPAASLSAMATGSPSDDYAAELRELRRRADEAFANPRPDREPGQHQSDLAELGLRVSVTRSRYPNRRDGVDQYAVTLSRTALDRAPDATDVRLV